MSYVLIADIGGSTSRFACTNSGRRPEFIKTIANDRVAGLRAAIADYLDDVGVQPQAAVLAVAGPVAAGGDVVALTNRAWKFRLSSLRDEFRFTSVRAVNDFEALAWALPSLRESEIERIGNAREQNGGVKVVLGPGTGLGVAALVPAGDHWHAIASEGGHVSFGPASPDEDAVFGLIRDECGRVEAETILCGPGLVRLHRALHGETLSPEAIVTQAAIGVSRSVATANLFARLLGRFAGDVALTFKATGGVYIAGGVACGLRPLFSQSGFREAFEAHAPHDRLLAAIPTALITCSEPGLIGCAALAERFLAEYELTPG